jgi:hypothetical protein
MLVPTDFSDCSSGATDLAVDLARAFDAALVIMHAYELPAYDSCRAPRSLPAADRTREPARAAPRNVAQPHDPVQEPRLSSSTCASQVNRAAASVPEDVCSKGARPPGIGRCGGPGPFHDRASV